MKRSKLSEISLPERALQLQEPRFGVLLYRGVTVFKKSCKTKAVAVNENNNVVCTKLKN